MPFLPELPGSAPEVRVRDSASGDLVPAAAGPEVSLYVCGITPYDATHMGHAATYVTFDVLGRVLRDAGHTVRYVQNITDIDDPLLERAERDGVDWRELATKEIALFREDMTALQVIPPDEYLGAVESIPTFVVPIESLVGKDIAYAVPVPADASPRSVAPDAVDWYFDVSKDPRFGEISGLDAEQMVTVFGENGGDPDRAGKRHRIDPLLWRAEREGEPAWDGESLGRGRPGWHIECACLALDHLGPRIDVQGGGSDLIFPHHEMSAAHAQALTGEHPFARAYVHQGMVGYQGEKMSKSKGNLVRVSALRAEGVDPMVIRLALLAHAHDTDWEWTAEDLASAAARLDTWRSALSGNGGPDAEATLSGIRAALADGLDTPKALAEVDAWARRAAASAAEPDAEVVEGAPGVLARALDALLGVRI